MKRSKLSISIILLFIFIFQVASPSAAALRSGNIGSYDNVKKSAAEGKEINGIPTNVNLSEERMQEIVGQNSSYIKKNQPSVSPIIAEETSLRTETKKHFRHADGSYSAAIYPEAVHYQDETGAWKEIDNTLVLSAKNDQKVYSTKSSGVKVSIPETLAESQKISLSKDNKSIEMTFLGARFFSQKDINNLQEANSNAKAEIETMPRENKSLDKSGLTEAEIIYYENQEKMCVDNHTSKVTYSNLLPNTDFEYIISSSKLKENIVVKKPNGINTFVFDLSFDGYTASTQQDGSIKFYENNENEAFILDAPYMIDANGETSDSVQLQLKNKTLTLSADPSWLNDPSRVYPVTIDPTFTICCTGPYGCKDTYVYSGFPSKNYENKQYNYIGTDPLGMNRLYLYFPLGSIREGAVITNAELTIKQSYANNATNRKLYIYDLSNCSSWDPTTITWNNQPVSTATNGPRTSNPPIPTCDYVLYNTVAETPYTFNVTNTVRYWFEKGDSANKGFLLTTDDESARYQTTIYAYDNNLYTVWPALTMDYLLPVGLEDYWSYETVDLERSGTININDFSGSLVWTHNDISLNGNRLPIQISHIYNSSQGYVTNPYTNMRLGKNVSLNIQGYIYNSTGPNPTDPVEYKYFDGDGTEHFFHEDPNSGELLEDDNRTIKLTIESSTGKKTISDADNNRRVFNANGQLIELWDTHNNCQKISIENNRIISISDVFEHSSDNVGKRLVTFSYNSDKQLIGITDPIGRTISFSYSDTTSNAKLVSITYPDEKETLFSYSSDLLSQITAFNSKSVTIDYSSSGYCGRRVGKLHQIDKAGSEYDYLSFSYYKENSSGHAAGNNQVQKKDGTIKRFLFDELGRTTEVNNDFDQTQYAVYGNSDVDLNKLIDQSELQTISTNLLKNHGFERNEGWTALQSTTNGSYGYSNEESRNGNRSMKLTLNNNTYDTFEIDQDFSAESNTTYTISTDIYIPEKLNVTGYSGASFGFVYCIDGVWHTAGSDWIGETSGWERFSKTFQLPSGTLSNCHAYVELARVPGTVYFDNVQVEKSGGPRNYNLVENSDFSNYNSTSLAPDSWQYSQMQSGDGIGIQNNGKPEFRAVGNPDLQKTIIQTVPVNAQAGEVIIIGGKAAAYAASGKADDGRFFGILANFYNSENVCFDTVLVSFDRRICMEHQTKATYYLLDRNCDHLILSFLYYKQVGNVAINNAFVYVHGFGEHYQYNNDGLIEAVRDAEGKETTYQYDNNHRLCSISQTVSGTTQTVATMDYELGTDNISTLTNNAGTTVEIKYTSDGQITKQIVTSEVGTAQEQQAEERMTYDFYNNYLRTHVDSNGTETTYIYDGEEFDETTGTVTGTIGRGLVVETIVKEPNQTFAEGRKTTYTYDENTDALVSERGYSAGTTVTTTFTMQDDLLHKIRRHSTSYFYTLDNQDRVKYMKVGSQYLVKNTYDSKQRLSKNTYANGAIHKNIYDNRNRVASEAWNDTPIVQYNYSDNDRLSQLIDLTTNTTYQYDYAFYSLLHRVTGSDGTKTLYDYDRSGHLSHLTFSKDNSIIYQARYSTNQKGSPEDVIIESMDNALLHYNYDGYNRLTGFSNGPVIAEMTYEANKSSRVHSYTNTDRNGNILQQYTYTYDKDGNIIGASDAIANTAFTYTYNGVNRIKTATDGTNTLAYTYNIGGNLTKVKQNGTTIHTYTYDNTVWKDQLTEFDGQTLTYDLNGNPLTYGNKTFTWQRGTQLAGITDAANSIAYAYDSQNHRVSKTVNGVTTDYLYSGDLLMRQVSGGHTLDFVYDTDRMIGFKYDGVPYFFAKNLYGDVVSVLNQSGAVVASYTYDPFGNVLSATGSMASINPIRYRSYYQDDETGWYYLTTRYYNPIWGRFLNADSTFIAGDDLFTGTNMYAYCNDNPLTFVDENGKAASLVDELLSRLTNRIANYVSQQVSKYLGEKIMTPIGDFFMEKIAPTVGGLMDELYTFLGVPRWNERNYPFQGIPLLQLRTFFPKNMELLAGLGAMFLDFHKNWDWNSKNYGNYTTLPGNYQWQKGVGYIWWYDWFFELGGSVGKERFPFVANNQVYVVWCWKGDYWNLGAGAEIGVYYTDDIVQAIKGYFEIDSENLLLDVKMNVYYTEDNVERQITTNFTQRNWWVTSFTPSIHRPKADDIRVALNVSFVSNNVHPNLIQPFYETWVSQPDEWDLDKIDIASPPVYQYLNGYQFNINY